MRKDFYYFKLRKGEDITGYYTPVILDEHGAYDWNPMTAVMKNRNPHAEIIDSYPVTQIEVIVINAELGTIYKEYIYYKNNYQLLRRYYEIIGNNCSCITTACYTNTGRDVIYVDDEGMFNHNGYGFKYKNFKFFGNGVVVGGDENGDAISAETTIAELNEKVKFILYI